jgi:1-acyl-sn-glycerol-3-phosphate acyltransferase
MLPTIPAAMPRRGGPATRAFGRAVLGLLRWRVEGTIPNAAKFVVIAAPHRSNWDFVVGLAAKFALGIDAAWLGKHTLFSGPFGFLFRAWGGIPVDRSSPHDTVAGIVERFGQSESLVVALAPEGTRRAGAEWKTGFWHIAHGAGVQVLPVAFDWQARVIRLLPAFTPTNVDADMSAVRSTYAAFHGRDD